MSRYGSWTRIPALVVLCGLFVLPALPAQAGFILCIDDYNVPVPKAGGFVPPTRLLKHAEGLGGERDVRVTNTAGTPGSGSFFVGEGSAVTTSNATAVVVPVFQYDGVDAGDTVAGLVNAERLGVVDLTAGGNELFYLTLGPSSAQTVTIEVHSGPHGGPPTGISTRTRAIPQPGVAHTFGIGFSSFVGNASFSAVTSIMLTLNSGQGLDVDSTLHKFFVGPTPEPSTLVLTLLGSTGLLGLARRRFRLIGSTC